MPHILIAGRTGSGKSLLAKELATLYRRQGRISLILDPLADPGWDTDPKFRFRDPDAFLSAVWRSRNCALFVDEAGEAIGRYDEPMHRLATRSRHWGHMAHFVTQRPKQIPPTVRTQCVRAYLFRLAKDDAKELAREFAAPGLEKACELPLLHYLKSHPDGKVTDGKVEIPATKALTGSK